MSELSQRQKWTDVIQPQRGWLDWRLAELWRARDLIMLFVWRDFVSVYKQTILGPLWYLIQPLLTTLTFTVIFGRIAALPQAAQGRVRAEIWVWPGCRLN